MVKPVRTYRIGETAKNNFGSTMIIKDYNGAKDIVVEFPEYNNWSIKTSYQQFKNGLIKCPYERRTFGVGFIGEGKYAPKEDGITTRRYEVWRDMIQRCYNDKMILKNPTYAECTVCDEWHNFQAFAEWYDNNYYEIPGMRMQLDKDILNKHNKVYSPNSCIFVPEAINKLFVKAQRRRGECPMGVHKLKKNSKYRADIHMNGKGTTLGTFDTPEEAFTAYKTAKENYIKEIADQYKDLIPKRLYDAMYEYEIEYDD